MWHRTWCILQAGVNAYVIPEVLRCCFKVWHQPGSQSSLKYSDLPRDISRTDTWHNSSYLSRHWTQWIFNKGFTLFPHMQAHTPSSPKHNSLIWVKLTKFLCRSIIFSKGGFLAESTHLLRLLNVTYTLDDDTDFAFCPCFLQCSRVCLAPYDMLAHLMKGPGKWEARTYLLFCEMWNPVLWLGFRIKSTLFAWQCLGHTAEHEHAADDAAHGAW